MNLKLSKKDVPEMNSVISELTDDQHFYISLICRSNDELVRKQIITPTQKTQISKYIMDRTIFNSERKLKSRKKNI